MSSFDVVVPNNNEQDFIDTAIALGHTGIVFLTTNSRYIAPKSDLILIKTAYWLMATLPFTWTMPSPVYIILQWMVFTGTRENMP